MGLVNLKEILREADARKYAVGAFNVVNLESLQAILDAGVEKRSPVILNIAEVHFKYVDLESICPVIRRAAEQVPIPVALHLDHGLHFETIVRALRCGFTSVMFDGSMLPYEENLEATKDIVRIAHAVGVTVEAELGHVGGAEGGSDGAQSDPSLYTDPYLAADFVRKTKVDALAVAIGSAHGIYKSEPKLDFERLRKIKEVTGIPLVLHGGSGIPAKDFRMAIELGICKINVYTDMAQSATLHIKEKLQKDPNFFSFPDLMLIAREAIKETVMEKIDIFGSAMICESPNAFCQTCGACVLATSVQEAGSRTLTSTDKSGGVKTYCQECGACNGKGESHSEVDLSEEELARVISEVLRRLAGEAKVAS